MQKRTIQVNSIFEGFMPSANFGSEREYLTAIGIDPDVPSTDDSSDIKTGGFIRPVSYEQFSGSEVDSSPIAIITTPKGDITWVILANGKIIACEDALTAATNHSIGQVTGNSAQGAFYLNNYIYILGTGSAHDDASRIGPLDTLPFDTQTANFTVGLIITGGTSGATARIVSQVDGGATGTLTLDQISGIFLDNEIITDSGTGSATVNRPFSSLITNGVWKGATLGSQAALGNTTYPKTLFDIGYLSHFGILHTDGVGYFLDYQSGIGYIHKIQTKKTTNQGDTNDGSAFGSIGGFNLPFDHVPITMCSMGIDIVVGSTLTTDGEVNQGNAYLLFWNAADDLFYRKVKLPDPICSALWYDNGNLYGLSGSLNGGYRLFQYIGGDSIKTLAMIEDGFPPLQSAIDSVGNKVVWAANTTIPFISSGLYGFGSKSGLLPSGLHNIAKSGFV